MFGYLKIDKGELLVREYEAYKSVYCGLCRQLGKSYSLPARIMLSYDCTFYTILVMSLEQSCTGFKNGRCTCNPFKKCAFAQCSAKAYSKAAALSVILVYYKLIDDIADSGFLKSFLCRIIKPLFSHYRKKAVKKYSYNYIDSAVSEMLNSQLCDEKSSDPCIDSSAHPTAHMLGTILKYEAKGSSQELVLYEFGYHIGRWIYLADAADDIAEDRKSGNYNPFIKLGKTDSNYIGSVLSMSLARAYNAYNLMEITDFKGILDNMLLRGFPLQQQKIIDKLKETEQNE